ncbi:MAG: VanW family protein [Actinomycetota bacterium]|nr:VanW family protein [Actinomycetota bacterium]
MGLLRRRGAAADPVDGRNGRRFAIAFFLAIFLLLGGLYAAGYAFTSDRVPQQVSVSGVEIGGLLPGEARAKLSRELAPRADRPILAHHGEQTYRISPARAGLRLDVAATVRAAGGGRSLNPLRMIEVLTGGEDVEPVLDVDRTALDAALRRVGERVRRQPVEAEIRFVHGRAKPVYPTPGRTLDAAATARAVQETFLDREQAFDLPVEQVPTRLSGRDVDAAMRRFAEPAMSGPVTVQVSGRSARLSPARIGAALSMVARHGRLVPDLDRQKLAERAEAPLDPLTAEPRPAAVVLRDGSPQVVRGRAGTEIDHRRLARKVLGVLTKTGDARTVRIKAQTVKPQFGVDDARGLGVKEVVSSFTTEFPHSSYRNTNLGRAAEKINGTVLKPGDVFSLNEVVGERTAENGFTKGYIIDDGVLVEDFGGGVSQVATTTYNAAFFAGLKDIEHHPHSLYFDRYPMGREATVAWGALDLRFQNTTPYGVLVQAWIEPSTPSSYGEMHVRMWSTKHWEIKAGLSEQYDFTQPGVRYDPSKRCVEQIGMRGFEVDVFRYFHRHGERVRTEKDHVTYDAADTVHCQPRPQPEQESQPAGGDGSGG